MQLTRIRCAAAMTAVAATIALCSPSAIQHTLADPQQEELPSAKVASSETIPFDPPVIYPGFGSHMDVFKREPLRGHASQSSPRDALFRDEDRKNFKALHPFLLTKPKVYSTQDGQQGTVTFPDPKPKRL